MTNLIKLCNSYDIFCVSHDRVALKMRLLKVSSGKS